jgi:putative FmdB family regulatory protein
VQAGRVPAYDYRCSFCGPFTLVRSIWEATDVAVCPDCEGDATRVFASPEMFTRTSAVRRALEAEKARRGPPA